MSAHCPTDTQNARARLEIAVGNLFYQNVPRMEIARRLGVTPKTVTLALQRMDCIPDPRQEHSAAQARDDRAVKVAARRKIVAALRVDETPYRVIARRLGVSKHTVENDIKAIKEAA